MFEALYGLAGALGGALVTSAAAYWGPLQMQRRAFTVEAERAEAARREDEAERQAEAERAEATRRADVERAEAARREAVAEREMARQQAEQERSAAEASRRTERDEAAAVQAHERREAEITRIIRMRTTTRAWADLLARAVQDLELGRPVDIERFDAEVSEARIKAQDSLDNALHDGIWIRQSYYGYPAQLLPSRQSEQPSMRVFAALGLVTGLTRAAAIRGGPLDQSRALELREALDQADEVRGALSATLLNRLEDVMGVTVVVEPAPLSPTPGVLLLSPPEDQARSGETGHSGDVAPAVGVADRIIQQSASERALKLSMVARRLAMVRDWEQRPDPLDPEALFTMEDLVRFCHSLLVQWPDSDLAADTALEEVLETYERVLRRVGREETAEEIRGELDSRRARRARRGDGYL